MFGFLIVRTLHTISEKKMIYTLKLFVAFIIVASVSAVTKFPLKKRDNKEFVASVLSRAAKGIK